MQIRASIPKNTNSRSYNFPLLSDKYNIEREKRCMIQERKKKKMV